ncbi:uncharacterized zinc finger CCHC domain-containing protein At4g19190 [Telopea speciosissima]|uniref:uncharacterized zinc finger CCHC domain-containing protein At4g19190 n=1 Tax=Telopea speciosissima TaxID=54955 RepID=UPI001CC4A0DA|nr:uncharacterized zinc finger CCHC domain-containing protein At4g19190 [Telopea speciosissima]
MEEEGGSGSLGKLSKKLSEKAVEVDYKTKAGTAWSHSYLNQKPWHPLSYPNQRRKWIAEQTDAQRNRRAEEISKEFAQEQDFFRQTALISKKEKEKVETMKAVSFMYVRPPGYNAESAKAAEIADERKRMEHDNSPQDSTAGAPTAVIPETMQGMGRSNGDKKKPRPKDVFGRALPTEEEFSVLKNAPRLETGLPARVKPFGIEVRNVKCVRCGNYGHQSGDRECPLKDAIMPNEENRLKRDDPLTAIMAHIDPTEPLKWELKQKPGLSPPRGGFKPDDPNQQIVAEDIFDEYGGFLSSGNIPELLTNFSVSNSRRHSRKKSKLKSRSSVTVDDFKARHESRSSSSSSLDSDMERRLKKKKRKMKEKKQHRTDKQHNYALSTLDTSDSDTHHRRSKYSCSSSSLSESSYSDRHHRRTKRLHHCHRHRRRRHHHHHTDLTSGSD